MKIDKSENIEGIYLKPSNMKPLRKAILMTAEQAKSLYEQNKSFRNTLLSEFTDEELGIKLNLKYWHELGKSKPGRSHKVIEGWWISSDSVLTEFGNASLEDANRNIFVTQKQALSTLAMAQLSQLMADLGDECDVDWGGDIVLKYTIVRFGDVLLKDKSVREFQFLAFKTESVRDAFFIKHKGLIRQYFMI